MSKIESGGIVLNVVRFDLEGEISAVLDESRHAAAQKDLRLNVEILPFDHKDVLGDSERLGQALRDLLDNAVKYTPPAERSPSGRGSCRPVPGKADITNSSWKIRGWGLTRSSSLRFLSRLCAGNPARAIWARAWGCPSPKPS